VAKEPAPQLVTQSARQHTEYPEIKKDHLRRKPAEVQVQG
jgi:hypothetical protein